MFSPSTGSTTTVRAVFLIDPDQIVRGILYYPRSTGRNIPEILRMLEALQTTDKYQASTPADWYPGQPVVVPAPGTMQELEERLTNPQGYNCLSWYLCFKQV